MQKLSTLLFLLLFGSLAATAQQKLQQAALVYTMNDTYVVNGGAPRHTTGSYVFAYSPGEYRMSQSRQPMDIITVNKCVEAKPTMFMFKENNTYAFEEPVKSNFLEMGKIKLQSATITYIDESASIAGFDCKKAVMTLSLNGRPEVVEVWYTPDYQLDGCFDNFFRELKGLPVNIRFNYTNGIKLGGVDMEQVREFMLDSLYTNTGVARIPLPAEGTYTRVTEQERMKVISELFSDSRRATPRGTPVSSTTMSSEGIAITRTVFNPFTIDDTLSTFSGIGRDGITRSSASTYKNKAMVINFWFTQCGPCIKEMPILNNAVTRYKNKNVAFISITYSNQKEVEPFFKQNTFAFDHIIDASDLIKKYGVASYPATVITDSKHIIRYVKIGSFADDAELTKAIDKIL